jgi:hypothetical protein
MPTLEISRNPYLEPKIRLLNLENDGQARPVILSRGYGVTWAANKIGAWG